MKDPFKNFTIRGALKLLSAEGLLAVCSAFNAEFSLAQEEKQKQKNITSLRDDAYAALTQNEANELKVYSLLRIGYFFHQQSKAAPNLIKYVATKNCAVDEEMLKACATEAEQVIRLGILYPQQVHEYFIISLHTLPSRRYWQDRGDYYSKDFSKDQDVIDKLQNGVKKVFAEQGRGHVSELKQFEYCPAPTFMSSF